MKPGRLVFLLGMAFLLLVTASPSAAAQAKEEVVRDVWHLMKMSGDESGWWHEKTVRLPDGKKAAFRSESRMHDRSMALGEITTTISEEWIEEDANGRIVAMHSTSFDSDEKTVYHLTARGETADLVISTMGTSSKSSIPWDPETLGSMGLMMLVRKNLEPGRKFSFKFFEFELGEVLTAHTEVRAREETDLIDGKKATLWHTVSIIESIPGVEFHEWYDDSGEVAKITFDLYGSLVEEYRTTEERAKRSLDTELEADTFVESLVRPNISLPSPLRLDSVLYRFEAKLADVGLPDTMGDDIRQEVIEHGGSEAVVRISTMIPKTSQKRPMADPPAELAEYLEPNAFIQSDHAGLKARAAALVGDETDAWAAACLIEAFVSRYITNSNFSTDFATAAEVFERRSGDCTEYGVLLAALCRAAGIPARVASGLTYVDGSFGGHMWTEVWIDGKWYGLDGTLGNGKLDPCHIRFSTSSLKRGKFAGTLVADTLGLNNLKLTVIEFVRDGKTTRVTEDFEAYRVEGNRYTNVIHEVSITKPEDFTFMPIAGAGSGDVEEDDSILLFINGRTTSFLSAIPADRSFGMDEFEAIFIDENGEVLSKLPRKVSGVLGRVYMIDYGDFLVRIIMALKNETLYSLTTIIVDEERDVEAFEQMANSLRFSVR